MDDRALLRDLKQAIQATEGQGAEVQAAAINDVLARHGATADDVRRLLGIAKRRRRTELLSLHERINGLIEHREVDEATAAAVDAFLRGRAGPSAR